MSGKGNPVKRCVVLLSGGLDSATALYFARKKAFLPVCLIFDYGQRHRREIESAKKIAFVAGSSSRVVKISLPWQGSSLLDKKINLPIRSKTQGMSSIPIPYVPARNIIFLSFALSFAEAIKAEAIFIGANALDYSGYPDCRPEYIAGFERLGNLATKAGVEGKQKLKIHTPLIQMTKAQIIKKGLELGADYSLTHSCYDPSETGEACGECDSCLLRLKGFREAGIPDPAKYRANVLGSS